MAKKKAPNKYEATINLRETPLPPRGDLANREPQILAEAASFVLPLVSVTWEGCEGLCDHPAPDSRRSVPWNVIGSCP